MGVFDGMEQKFVVVKREDVESCLTEDEQTQLKYLLRKIDQVRFQQDKNINVYLVINIDEPYASEVAGIMQDHGQWGKTIDPNQVEAILEGSELVLPTYVMGD